MTHPLDRLFAELQSRAALGDAESSYTARLLAKGRGKIAQKLGEEAVETVIAALQGDREELVKESADLLYHWLVLLLDAGLSPDDVYAELQKRHGTSGLEEKRQRGTP